VPSGSARRGRAGSVRRTAPGSRPQLRRAATSALTSEAARATTMARRIRARTSAHHPAQEICVGPAAPGTISLTRCTAAKRHVQIGPAGPGRWVPPRRHLGRRRPKRSPVLPGQAHSAAIPGSGGNRPGGRPASARTPDPNWRAMLFAAAAAVLCCCTKPWNPVIRFSNYGP
jgi:hypothetical protein